MQIDQTEENEEKCKVSKEKELFEKRIRDEENDFYRRRAQRDEIDHGKR